MTYKDIILKVKDIAENQPNINQTYIGDVYEVNHQQDVKYNCFVITQDEVVVDSNDETMNVRLILFYIDRLTASEDNRLDIQSAGVTFFNRIMPEIEDIDGIIIERYSLMPFNERFNDTCAGVYTTVEINMPISLC